MSNLPKLFERMTSGFDRATLERLAQTINGYDMPTNPNDIRQAVSELLELRSLLDKTIMGLEEVAEASLRNGQEVFGYTLQKGRTSREIINEERLAMMLLDMGFDKDEIYQTSMRGIPHIETLLKAKNAENALAPHIRCITGQSKLKRA